MRGVKKEYLRQIPCPFPVGTTVLRIETGIKCQVYDVAPSVRNGGWEIKVKGSNIFESEHKFRHTPKSAPFERLKVAAEKLDLAFAKAFGNKHPFQIGQTVFFKKGIVSPAYLNLNISGEVVDVRETQILVKVWDQEPIWYSSNAFQTGPVPAPSEQPKEPPFYEGQTVFRNVGETHTQYGVPLTVVRIKQEIGEWYIATVEENELNKSLIYEHHSKYVADGIKKREEIRLTWDQLDPASCMQVKFEGSKTIKQIFTRWCRLNNRSAEDMFEFWNKLKFIEARNK